MNPPTATIQAPSATARPPTQPGPAAPHNPPSNRVCRGGNRLNPDQYRPNGPAYQRVRDFTADPERRDRHQKTRTRRAIGLAVTRGELPPLLGAVLHQLIDRCNDRLLEPGPDDGPRCSGWWSLHYIHDLIYPQSPAADNPTSEPVDNNPQDDPQGDETRAGSRTAGRWMSALVELGWVEKIHRHRLVNGIAVGTSNLWRIKIPAHLRHEIHASEDAARSTNNPRRGRTTLSTRAGTSRPDTQAKRPHALEQAACDHCRAGWIETRDHAGHLREMRCPNCRGTGRASP